jgi:8-oxo-dGTP diphosphatase
VAEEKRWLVGVAGAVVRQGRLLLVRHTYGEKKGCWALPGGYVTHDERLDQAAVREVLEELGLQTEVVDAIGLVTRYSDKASAVFVVFRMRPLSGQPMPVGMEVDRIGWFTAKELSAMTDEELLPDIRHPAVAALVAGDGLLEDSRFPHKSDTSRAFLIPWDLRLEEGS